MHELYCHFTISPQAVFARHLTYITVVLFQRERLESQAQTNHNMYAAARGSSELIIQPIISQVIADTPPSHGADNISILPLVAYDENCCAHLVRNNVWNLTLLSVPMPTNAVIAIPFIVIRSWCALQKEQMPHSYVDFVHILCTRGTISDSSPQDLSTPVHITLPLL